MHLKSNNIEIMTHNKADKAFAEFFQSLLSRRQTGLETLTKGSDFIFDFVIVLQRP